MTNDELDRILSQAEDIVPSSGFTASVMEAVQREASVPAPIPFPWKRAIPGIVAAAIAMALLIVGTAIQVAHGGLGLSPVWQQIMTGAVNAGTRVGANWIAGALLVAFASVKLSMRFVVGIS